MMLPLIVLDNTKQMKNDPDHAFSLADLKAWENEHGRIPFGSFVALRTDMSKDFETNPEYFKRGPFSAWSFEVIKYLYEERGVVATGHESLDTDTTPEMLSETYILKNNHYQIEVMANLDHWSSTVKRLATVSVREPWRPISDGFCIARWRW